MPAIERVCARLGLMPGGLERVSVSVGPGGYTGIRVAVVTAQAMAEVSGAGMAAVPTADAVAHAARTAGDVDGPFAVCLASKRHAAFVTCFEGAGTGAVVGVVEAEVLSTLGVRCLIADRFLPAGFVEAAAGLGMGVIEPRFDAAAVLACGESASVVRGDPLLPVYPREPEAVRKWRERPSPRNRD
jgi:tRNA threonylcarbamoyl adenosine modification protein YeaZ